MKLNLTLVLLFYRIYKTRCKKNDKMLGLRVFYLFFVTHLINLIKHEHSCKILYNLYFLVEQPAKMMEEYQSTDDFFGKRKMVVNKRRMWIGVLVALVAGFVVGILIGRFGTCPDEKPEERQGAYLDGIDQAIIQDEDPDIESLIMNGFDSDTIRENLR